MDTFGLLLALLTGVLVAVVYSLGLTVGYRLSMRLSPVPPVALPSLRKSKPEPDEKSKPSDEDEDRAGMFRIFHTDEAERQRMIEAMAGPQPPSMNQVQR